MNDKVIPFEEFEKAVMKKILEREDNISKILWQQYKSARVIKRDFTGSGFFTSFEASKDSPRITETVDRSYGDVIASINGSSFDFGFVLFLENGMLSCLEGYTWTDKWPETIRSYELKHTE